MKKNLSSLWLCCLLVAWAYVAQTSPVKNWDLLSSVALGKNIRVDKFRSSRTGVTLVHAQAESPIVNGYFCLATEAHTDDGLPHTLEHLIFLGSEDYPYKEMLDLSANRCLADRTNAWTATDHTCYTVYTAGSDGFASILPIYLDHILYPLLRDEDFITEVHHINDEGEDAGVVYSEMQGVENTSGNLLYFSMLDLLYPGPCSYQVQTGGKLKNLRKNTTNEKVREYHKKFYRPENLVLIVTGGIGAEEIFKALESTEEKILRKTKVKDPFVRPFQTEYPDLTENLNQTIQFPSSDETFGRATLAWRLPGHLWATHRRLLGLKLLGSYLTSTSLAPLMKDLVEIPNPLATDVDFDFQLFSDPTMDVLFKNVPVDRLDQVEKAFRESLDKLTVDNFDMDRMRTLIKRKFLASQMKLENGPHNVVPTPSVLDHLYRHSDKDLEQFLYEGTKEYENHFLNKKAEEWIQLMKDVFSTPRVRVLAQPSLAYHHQLESEEESRLAAQKVALGPAGKMEAGARLEAALQSQVSPPEHVLNSVPKADVDKIIFRRLKSYNFSSLEQPKGFALRDIPFRIHVDDLDSQFVRYYVFLDLSKIQSSDRPYVVLLTESWLQSPLRLDDGTFVTLDELVRRKSEDVLTMYNDLGYKGSTFTPGGQSENIMFYVESLVEKYEEGIQLLKEILLNVEFTAERTQVLVSQFLNSFPNMKLSSSSIVSALSDNIYFNEDNNIHHASFLRQFKFFKQIDKQLKKDPAVVLSKLSELRTLVVQPSNVFLYLATDLEVLTNKLGSKASQLWAEFFSGKSFTFPSEKRLSQRFSTASEWSFADPSPAFRHAIAGVPGTESCYLRQTVPYEIRDWEDDDVAAVRVMLQYLSDQMYNKIRGPGLTYGASASGSVTEGRLQLRFSRSSHLIDAYGIFREVAANYSGPNADWSDMLLVSARGSQVYTWAQREETVENLAGVAVKAILRGTADTTYNRRFVKKLAAVTLDDVKVAARKHLPKFLDPTVSQTSVTCGPGDVEAVKQAFQGWGLQLEHIEDIENSFLAS